jgi:hypothetical protein
VWLASHLADAAGIAPVFAVSALGLVVMAAAFRRRLLSSPRAP